jgi:hypothetical protein
MADDSKSVKQIENTSKPWLWKEGQSGNPNGRPRKGLTLTDIARGVLDEELPSGMTRKEALVRKVASLAYDGNETMIKLLWTYIDGLQRQEIQHSGSIEHHLTYEEVLQLISGQTIEVQDTHDTDSD